MPDHVHFVVVLKDQGGQMAAPTLPHVVGTFKTVTARSINRIRNAIGKPVWQRNYYERVVRDEDELNRIREYIRANPGMPHAHDGDDIPLAWS
jgi:REP element-mobilizing transposase RayT